MRRPSVKPGARQIPKRRGVAVAPEPRRTLEGRNPPLRAFIAMRIGQTETDRLFRTSLYPTLRKAGLAPVRIDRVEFNDDIDDRIVAEIRRADLVVADLTFARPSVYYEGGFATGLGKPVIYTARRDHFRPQPSDPFGNLRVHFDLQMKNIIAWSTPDSSSFRKRLARRLAKVAAPLVRSRHQDAELAEARRAFLSLPLAERLRTITELVSASLQADDYGLIDLESSEGGPYRQVTSRAPRLVAGQRVRDKTLASGFIGTRASKGLIDAVWLRVEESLPLTVLRAMNTLLAFAPPFDMNPAAGVRPTAVVNHIILCSIQPLPTSRLHTAFPTFKQQDAAGLAGSFQQVVPTARIDDVLLFTSRHAYVPDLGRALVFKRGKNHDSDWGSDYDIANDVIRRQRPDWVAVIPSTKRNLAAQYEVLSRVKTVRRRVVIHVVDRIDSARTIQAAILQVHDRIRRSRDRHI